MKRLLSGSIMLMILASCNNNSDSDKKEGGDTLRSSTETTTTTVTPVLSDEEKSEGWQPLFDAQSTKGWHKYGGTAVGSAWKIAEGAIYLDTSTKKDWKEIAGEIVTDEDFESFDLRLEWK